MKKLLIFHSALAPYRLDFFNGLADNFDCIIIFLSKNNRNQNFDQQKLLSQARFQYDFLDTKMVLFNRDINFGYSFYLKKYSPDIVIGGEYGLPTLIPYYYNKLVRKKYKLYTICDDSLDIAIQCNGLRKKLRNFLVPKLKGVILTNEEVAEWYSNYFSCKSKTIVFPIMRDEEEYRKKLKKTFPISKNYIKKYNLSNKRVVLYVGRLAKVKNLDLLLDCFDHVASINDSLLIVGDGPEKDKLLKKKNELTNNDAVHFVGRFENEELIAWYNVADIFVLPSIYEPFGAVVNEALAAGCFVLCSKYAGASHLIIDNENGFVIDPDNPIRSEKQMVSLLHRVGNKKKYKNEFLKPNLMKIYFKNYLYNLVNYLLS